MKEMMQEVKGCKVLTGTVEQDRVLALARSYAPLLPYTVISPGLVLTGRRGCVCLLLGKGGEGLGVTRLHRPRWFPRGDRVEGVSVGWASETRFHVRFNRRRFTPMLLPLSGIYLVTPFPPRTDDLYDLYDLFPLQFMI